MQQPKFTERKFVSVDPSKCTGCGICEYACALEKGETVNPLKSRIRTVRTMPFFNFALTCRFCEDAPCVKACPENAIVQSEKTGILVPVANTQILAQAIVDLLSNNQKADFLAQNGRKVVEENFSSAIMAEKYKRVYEEISGN